MKKTGSFFLTAALLFAALSILFVSPALADSKSRTPLDLELVSGKVFVEGVEQDSNQASLGQYFNGWTPIFDSGNTTTRVTPFLKAKTTIEVVGKLSQPTAITSVVFRTVGGGARLNGVVIMFSQDGVNWTRGITLQKESAPDKSDVEFPIPADTVLYSYVKIFKSGDIQNETQNAVKGNYLDVYHIRFYSEPANTNRIIEASYQQTLTSSSAANVEKFFDFENRDMCTVSGTVSPDDLLIGKFSRPTVISDVFISYFSASSNWTKVEASEDGVNWKQIAQMTGIWGNAASPAEVTLAHMTVSDTTAYSYIRIQRNHAYGSGWKAYSIGFLGEQQGAEVTTEAPTVPSVTDTPAASTAPSITDAPSVPTAPAVTDVITAAPSDPNAPVHMRGYQLAVGADGRYAIRLIATTDRMGLSEIGMIISCQAADGRQWSFRVSSDEQLRRISQTVDGVESLILAEELDGAKIYTVTVAGIPADVGSFTLTVTPYAVVGGETLEGTTKTLTQNFAPDSQNNG